MKQYPCPLSNTGSCQYGGNKRFSWGFASGTASYCRKAGRFVHGTLTADLICPIPEKRIDETTTGAGKSL